MADERQPNDATEQGRESETSEQASILSVPWGSWDLATGEWSHNELGQKTRQQQLAENVANGFACWCGFIWPSYISWRRCTCEIGREHLKD